MLADAIDSALLRSKPPSGVALSGRQFPSVVLNITIIIFQNESCEPPAQRPTKRLSPPGYKSHRCFLKEEHATSQQSKQCERHFIRHIGRRSRSSFQADKSAQILELLKAALVLSNRISGKKRKSAKQRCRKLTYGLARLTSLRGPPEKYSGCRVRTSG